MTIDSTELIRRLPAMIQGRKKFAKIEDGGNYHVGAVDKWCLTYAEVVQAIEDFCEYKKTHTYRFSAPVNGDWNVLNAYYYEPQESEGVKKDCTTCILDGTDACVSGASDDEVCEGYIAESEEQA